MSALLRVQVPLQADHSEQSEAQLHEGDRVWEGSVERNCEPRDTNRIEGVAEQGERVMALLQRQYDKLRLKINASKSAIASAFGRKFLGYAFWAGPKREVKRKAARQALETFKQRVRELTRRSGGCSIKQVIAGLRPYVIGWKAYFSLAQTPGIWRTLDGWRRHRIRAIQLKHWRRGPVIHRELLARGASASVARQVAANSRRWQRNSRQLLNAVFTIAYFDRLGMPRLA